MASKQAVVEAIRKVASALGRPPSRSEFIARSGVSEYRVLEHFPSSREAVHAAGFEPNATNKKLDNATLLSDWGALVRKLGHIPTRLAYRQAGTFSPTAFEKHLGPWSNASRRFEEFAKGKDEWADVLSILPTRQAPLDTRIVDSTPLARSDPSQQRFGYNKIQGRPTYGNPLDFRGLRHEPVNEDGVILLFGMVARELGYLVEAVQGGFPDCEAKRQIAPGKWQTVRIEFEFESRNFRDHGHQCEGCDLIVCWRHNWEECPLEVVALSDIIPALSASDE
jgi:Homing endonuclease associated repeat